MRRWRFVTCGVLFLLLGADDGESAAEVLERLQARYAAIRDFRADFVQTSWVASLGREDVTRGSVVVERPGRMLWKYAEPDPLVIVLDGDALRIYNPAERQLQIAPVASGAISPTALSFLLGDGVLSKFFGARRIRESNRAEIGLKLIPLEDSGFEYLELWLDPASYQLRESVLVDLFGNRTRVRFSAVAENKGVEEEVFSIRVPEDTEVIDLR
ncbi:MAG: outer membrane lipoprotein carrier protein LolA [Deltaproteobacteria bacterium]|nr:MAG: outer membrane lipoprotein carrier protein LolA [Deltaproteobacteria bacterium]